MYSKEDKDREFPLQSHSLEEEEYRTDWRRDYARLVHSPSFRRLQGKTQLFPASENDFFRNRLTHSLEVAQIAKSIAIRLNNREKPLKKIPIDTDLVEFAALAHDLGHPPFGHQGEEALDECMIDNGGFEGNAQTLRILAKIEKREFNPEWPTGYDVKVQKDKRVGLNLSYRALASVLKYDEVINERQIEREQYAKIQFDEGKEESDKVGPVKGYYHAEKELVDTIKSKVTGGRKYGGKFKTIECSIMDIADDIAYSTYDLEDGFKAGFYTPLDLISTDPELIKKIQKKVSKKLKRTDIDGNKIITILKDVFKQLFDTNSDIKKKDFIKYIQAVYKGSKGICENGYFRTGLTSSLVGEYIRSIKYTHNPTIPALSSVELGDKAKLQVEVLKRFTYEYQVMSSKLKIAEFRGKDIVKKIFEALNSPHGYELLPPDYRALYNIAIKDRKRTICDFIAGMTDKYLIEFYGRLTSESPETIFKPI